MNSSFSLIALAYMPLFIPAIMGLLIMLFSLLMPEEGKFFGMFSAVACLTALVPLHNAWKEGERVFGGAHLGLGYSFDKLGLLTIAMLLVGGALVCLMSMDYMERKKHLSGEYYSLILFAVSGMGFMATADSILGLFIGLETMSISLYVLAGILRNHENSLEASMKYLMLGAFSTGFMVFGGGLLYGSTGSFTYSEMHSVLFSGQLLLGPGLFWTGFVLFLVGLAFKLSLVPFHFWAPDVYQGSPTPVSAFMATCAKAAAVMATLRLFLGAVPVAGVVAEKWADVLLLLAVITLVVGNLVALSQTHLKRLLAYSSVSHAGYLALVLGGLGKIENSELLGDAKMALLFYVAAYLLMTIGMFAIASLMERDENTDEPIASYNGLGNRRPFLAATAGLLLLSLAGIPPTAGFFGKFYLFRVLIDAGQVKWAVFGMLMAVVGAFYYLRVIVAMYMRPEEEGLEPARSWITTGVVSLTALATLVLGFMPDLLLNLFKLA